MSKNVVIIGAGGHAKVIADIVLCRGDKVIGFLDDDALKFGKKIYKDLKVLGTTQDYSKYRDFEFMIAVGDNHARDRIAETMPVKWYTAIHPSAIIADTVKIGAGTVVMAGAIINSDSVVGKHCIINTGATIDHDNVLADFVHVSPGVHLAGTVKIGKYAWVCIGATIANNINITDEVILGAGAAAIKDLDEPGVYVGVPARRIK